MKTKKHNRKRFYKKYDFLQKSLFNFVDWRYQQKENASISALLPQERSLLLNSFKLKNKFDPNSKEMLSTKTILVGNKSKLLDFSTNPRTFSTSLQAEQNGSFLQKEVLDTPFLFPRISKFAGEFFPFKKPFMHYWVFPLLGLVLFTSKKDPFFPHLVDSSNTSIFSIFSRQENLKTTTNESSLNSQNSISYVDQNRMVYENQFMQKNYRELLEFEKKEFSQLCHLFLEQIEKEAFSGSKMENVPQNSFDQFITEQNAWNVKFQKIFWKYNCLFWNWHHLNSKPLESNNLKEVWAQKANFFKLENRKETNPSTTLSKDLQQQSFIKNLPTSSFYNANFLLESYLKTNPISNNLLESDPLFHGNQLSNWLKQLKTSELNFQSKYRTSKILASFIQLLETNKLNAPYKLKQDFEKTFMENHVVNFYPPMVNLMNRFSIDLDQIFIRKFVQQQLLNDPSMVFSKMKVPSTSTKLVTPSTLNMRNSSFAYSQFLLKKLQQKNDSIFSDLQKKQQISLNALQDKTSNAKSLAYELLLLRSYKKNIQKYETNAFMEAPRKHSNFLNDLSDISLKDSFSLLKNSKENLRFHQNLSSSNFDFYRQNWRQSQELYEKQTNFSKWQQRIFLKMVQRKNKEQTQLSLNTVFTEDGFTSMKNSIVKLHYPLILWKKPFDNISTSNLHQSSFSPINDETSIYFSNANASGAEKNQVMPTVMKDFRFQFYNSLKSQFEIFPSLKASHFESNRNKGTLQSDVFQLTRSMNDKNPSSVFLESKSQLNFWDQFKEHWFQQTKHSHNIGQRFSAFLENLSAQLSTSFEQSHLQTLEKHRTNSTKIFMNPTFKQYEFENSSGILTQIPYSTSTQKDFKSSTYRILKRKRFLTKQSWLKENKDRRFEKIFRTCFSSFFKEKTEGFESLKSVKNAFYLNKILKKSDPYNAVLPEMYQKIQATNSKIPVTRNSVFKLKTRFKSKNQQSLPFVLNAYFIKKTEKPKVVQKLPAFEKSMIDQQRFEKTGFSNTSVLKRLGFVFLQKERESVSFEQNFILSKNSLFSLAKPSVSSLTNDPRSFSQMNFEVLNYNIHKDDPLKEENSLMKARLQKEKYLQKKRRRKKQKLETRRRKKRKRFFPRPSWLRFSLYNKFLSFRHLSMDINGKTKKMPLLLEKEENLFQKFSVQKSWLKVKMTLPRNFKPSNRKSSYFARKNSPSKSFSDYVSTFSFYRKGQFEKKIYRNNKQKWGSLNQDAPYLEKIILRKMPVSVAFPLSQNNEHYKISNSILSEFQRLCWKSYWLQSNLTPYVRRIEKNFQTIKQIEKETSSIDYLRRWASEILGFNLVELLNPLSSRIALVSDKTNTATTSSSEPSLTRDMGSTHRILENFNPNPLFSVNHFNQKQSDNILWYFNIKNTLENENFVSSFSNFHYVEKIPEYNRILYERICEVIQNVKYNLNVDGQPSMKSYKVGRRRNEENITNHSSFMKRLNHFVFDMFGSHPTHSNLSLFSTDASIKPSGDIPTLRALWAFNKTHLFELKENNQVKLLWNSLKQREQAKSNKTKRFFSKSFRKLVSLKWNFFSENSKNALNQQTIGYRYKISTPYLDMSSAQKLRKVQEKSMNLGAFIKVKNYNHYLRLLKFRLKSEFAQSPEKFKFYNLKEIENQSAVATKPQASMKSSLNYWWSTGQWNFQSFFLATNYASPMETFYNNKENQTTQLSMKQSFDDIVNLSTTGEWSKNPNPSIFVGVQSQFLNLCVLVFHLSVFLSLMKIPEVRTVLKFHLLLLYKLGNSYLMVLYFIYDLLRNYQFQFVKMFRSISGNFQTEKQSASFIGKDFSFSSSPSERKDTMTNNKNADPKPFNMFFNKNSSLNNYFVLKKELPNMSSFYKTNNSIFYHSTFIEWTLRIPGSKILPFSYQKVTVSKQEKSQEFLNFEKSDPIHSQTNRPEMEKSLLKFPILVYSLSRRSSTFFSSFWFFVLKSPRILKVKMVPSVNGLSNQKQLQPSTVTFKTTKPLKESSFTIAWFQSILSLGILYSAKSVVSFGYGGLNLSYGFLLKILDLFESFMFIIYKFLEKPAELMVEWIAQVFLIEWASDVTTFVPETFDVYVWNSILKFGRNLRIVDGNLFVNSFLTSSNEMKLLGFLSSNTFGFLLQRRLMTFMEICSDSILKPDMDLIVRRKKGMIFWDIWAEILIQAAEKYNLNIPSLVSLKEEQELLIERLLQDSTFLQTKASLLKSEQTQNFMIPLMSLIQTERPTRWRNSSNFFESYYTMETVSNLIQKPNSLLPKSLSDKNQNVEMTSPLEKETKRVLFSKKEQTFEFKNFNNKKFTKRMLKNFDLLTHDQTTLKNLEKNVWKRWSSNQYLTYQSRETDLFLDFHPPKSLIHLNYLKYYEPAQNALGSLICQIYSGLFSKQVSKNILIVGPQGSAKSLLIQALAGETEMKIMTDNANRYALVQRGVAVGMKLLRDVFDAIALQTPCIFLMEDIHVIGEKRPMLISDDENAKMMQSSFGMDQEEVHERNQIMYQLSRHAMNDYRRPYKGDFSSSIPTNIFTQDLFSTRNIFQKNKATISSQSHPLPVDSIEKQMDNQGQSEKDSSMVGNEGSNSLNASKNGSLMSRLQLSLEKVFAPPATSPFTILMMKEQKKLKPKKLVKEIPWGGFSTDQMLLVSKNDYSVRVKVALLADLAMSQFSVKLDMITDLLVIIDSVRSNRGFVVFATTHVPSILDPALRRPGRLDEIIYLPALPNFMTRLEFLKLNLLNFSPTLDFMDYSLITSQFSENHLNYLISKTKLLLFNTKNPGTLTYPIYSPVQGLNIFLKEPIFENFSKTISLKDSNTNSTQPQYLSNQLSIAARSSKSKEIFNPIKGSLLQRLRNSKYFLNQLSYQSLDSTNQSTMVKKYTMLPSGPSEVLSFVYSQVGYFMIRAYYVKDPTSYGMMTWDPSHHFSKTEPFLFKALYGSRQELKTQTIQFFAGKVAQFFIGNVIQHRNSSESNSTAIQKQSTVFSQGFWNVTGSNHWRSASAFVFSILQKRYLYNKNLLVSKMLSFDNLSALKEPPSPPGSTIVMPSRNYENFKRTERDFQQKSNFSINEKIKKHQQQRFMKQLYNQPVQQIFHSEMVSKRQTVFSSASKELGYLDSFMQKPTSTSSFYQNRLLTRQRFSVINQWWNAQLAEHNAETTYLSDVDWRTMFVPSSEKSMLKLNKESSYQSLSGEFLLDFPDADQHYNPRQRRWFLHSTAWNYWLDFEQTLQYEIYYHFIMESFNSSLLYLDQNRELLDSFVFLFLQKGYLKEFDLMTFSSRFFMKDSSHFKS